MDTTKIYENYSWFITQLNLCGINTEKLVEKLGGQERIMTAVAASNLDSGMAYAGSLLAHLKIVSGIATRNAKMISGAIEIDEKSIIKVALLNQIAKVIMFTPNTNEWQVKNTGKIYVFENLPGALRCGERSTWLCSECDIKFTEEEYEAMKILDKDMTEDNYAKIYSSPLSIIIKNANDMANLFAREVYKKENK